MEKFEQHTILIVRTNMFVAVLGALKGIHANAWKEFCLLTTCVVHNNPLFVALRATGDLVNFIFSQHLQLF